MSNSGACSGDSEIGFVGVFLLESLLAWEFLDAPDVNGFVDWAWANDPLNKQQLKTRNMLKNFNLCILTPENRLAQILARICPLDGLSPTLAKKIDSWLGHATDLHG